MCGLTDFLSIGVSKTVIAEVCLPLHGPTIVLMMSRSSRMPPILQRPSLTYPSPGALGPLLGTNSLSVLVRDGSH